MPCVLHLCYMLLFVCLCFCVCCIFSLPKNTILQKCWTQEVPKVRSKCEVAARKEFEWIPGRPKRRDRTHLLSPINGGGLVPDFWSQFSKPHKIHKYKIRLHQRRGRVVSDYRNKFLRNGQALVQNLIALIVQTMCMWSPQRVILAFCEIVCA